MLGVAALAHFAAVHRHRLVALGVAADIVDAVAGAVAVGGIAVGRYVGRVRALHLGAFLLGVGGGVYGRFIVREVGFFFGE